MTIGIECHTQLKTRTKLFSGADNDAKDKAPNTTVSPICFGLPGTLPILNKEAVELAMRGGAALNAEIALVSSFDRKHYFYPDLPKGYQITQLERPIVGIGSIEVPLGDSSFPVRITRAHMEEDAGKLVHPAGADYSLADYNRAGTPLIEIVSEPDMHSPQQARAYAEELWLNMLYAGVTEGNLYYGNMRFDVNISVAKKGSAELGVRAEIKNLNSFRSVERAAEYEFKRQIEVIEAGGKLIQETRGFNEAKQKTFSQRSKEEANDYRYFPEADVPPIVLTHEHIDAVKAAVEPNLPRNIRATLTAKGLGQQEVNTLLVADAFANGEGYIKRLGELDDAEAIRFAANWMINRDIAEHQKGQEEGVLSIRKADELPSADQLSAIHALFKTKELSSNNADKLLGLIASESNGQDAQAMAKDLGMLQVNDTHALETIIASVIGNPANAKAVADVRSGQEKAIGFLVGQVMKESRGQANPGIVRELIAKKLI